MSASVRSTLSNLRFASAEADRMSAIRDQFGFTELAGRTLITWRMLLETAAEFEKVRTYAVEAKAQNFDRLELTS